MKPVLLPTHVTIYSIATAVLVANLYYAQPLLAQIAITFNVGISSSGFLVTLSQLGYAVGVFFIVPLGDRVDRRKLITVMLFICIIFLLSAALSTSYLILSTSCFIAGIASSATMVIIPYVASHSEDIGRGKAVGQVMAGLLIGILLARTLSGFVAQILNWRWMYGIAAATSIVILYILRRIMIKDELKNGSMNYFNLMLSLGHLIKIEREIRWRGWFALLGLGSFSILWTGLTFLLSGEPYNYDTAMIGIFGLIGGAGALSANIAGKLGDAGHTQVMTGVFSIVLLISWMILMQGGNSVFLVILGVFFVDVAVQGLQVTHQSVLYKLEGNIRSRVTSIFITSGFIGMSLGTALASSFYQCIGWHGIALLALVMAAILFISWVFNIMLIDRR